MSRHFAGGGGGPSALLVLDSEAGVIPSPPPRGSCRCTRRACRRTPRYYSFFLFLARTGLRLGEARSVRWGDLDLERREVRVERTVADESKRIGTPKAGHARTADLSRALVTALRHLEVESKAEKLHRGWRDSPRWVFPNIQGDVLDADKIRSAFKRALRAARLPEHFTPHSLRHSYASILIAEGVSPAYVQRQLGHSTYTLTVDTYGKWPPMGSKDVDRLDGPSGSKVVATAIAGSGDGGEDNSQVCELPSSSARPSSPSTPRGRQLLVRSRAKLTHPETTHPRRIPRNATERSSP